MSLRKHSDSPASPLTALEKISAMGDSYCEEMAELGVIAVTALLAESKSAIVRYKVALILFNMARVESNRPLLLEVILHARALNVLSSAVTADQAEIAFPGSLSLYSCVCVCVCVWSLTNDMTRSHAPHTPA